MCPTNFDSHLALPRVPAPPSRATFNKELLRDGFRDDVIKDLCENLVRVLLRVEESSLQTGDH